MRSRSREWPVALLGKRHKSESARTASQPFHLYPRAIERDACQNGMHADPEPSTRLTQAEVKSGCVAPTITRSSPPCRHSVDNRLTAWEASAPLLQSRHEEPPHREEHPFN